MREPFLDPEVIKVALATSLLNVKGGGDNFGKHVHRKLAEALGIPKDIAYRIKEVAVARLGNAWDVRRYCKETWI